MRKTRREFVKGTVALGLVAPLVGCGDDPASPLGPADLFQHGVASGDPLPDAVILWTRVTPDADPADDITVVYEVSLDASFNELVTMGTASTNSDLDYTVKVDVDGLEAGTTYYYRFRTQGRESIIGRTKTAPEGSVDRLRFGVMSCSNYAFGYFHGYRDAAKRADLDAIIHLGDYIYEYGNGGYGDVRDLQPPTEILSLQDYRTRYAYYRLDPDVQAVHQQHPFIPVWDDHELADNAYVDGAGNHMPDTEGSFAKRKKAALQAYREWMPMRGPDDKGRIFRRLQFGDLLDLSMLDTRMWARAQQVTDATAAADPSRTLVGADQLSWLQKELKNSTTTWHLIGQQVVFTQLLVGGAVINYDQWDGYPAERQRLYDVFDNAQIENLVMLTGDIHASGAAELTRNPSTYDPSTGDGVVGVEFIAPGVTSPFIADASIVAIALANNPPLHWADGTNRGYFVLDVTADRVQADWHHYPDPSIEDAQVKFGKAFSVAAGTPRLQEESKETSAPKNAPKLAPV